MLKFYAGTAVLVAVGLAAAPLVWSRLAPSDDRFAACRQTQVAGGTAEIGGPFELVSETGDTVTNADVIDAPTLVYFGYTFCPDVCPMDAARNADAVDALDEDGHEVKPVFITVDPERDTPEVLASFTDALHPDMVGLTGSPEQVREASGVYRAYSRRQEAEEDDPYYLVDHSTFTYLMLPEEGFVEYFRRDVSAEEMADRVACFVEAA